MFNKQIFILAHNLVQPTFYQTYKSLVRRQWQPFCELKEEQEKELRYLISFAYNSVPYYRTLFKELKITPQDIRTIEDLQKLPILTKEIIKQHWDEFKPVNLSSMKYYTLATGGSTGTPLQYRLLKEDRFLSRALLYRGWGYGGFALGDKMALLGGSSLNIGSKSRVQTKIHELARNLRKLSSFDMGQVEMQHYAEIINKFQPKFIRGYPSSIYFYSKWLEENDIVIHYPTAVFTTAEKLFPYMRETISQVFACEVYDGYGLNDGGVSAYECSEHSGLHIDSERSVMEVVDSHGCQMDEGQGEILATSLHNFAMPFIRYSTGDDVTVTDEKCNCGRSYSLLEEVVGRTVDFLVTPEGKHIHGWFFLYIFWEYCQGIKEYQVVQRSLREIHIKLVIDDDFDEGQLVTIEQLIQSKSVGWKVQFEFVDEIGRTRAGKYKFIVNETISK